MGFCYRYEQAYYVEGPPNMPLNPIAIRPTITESIVEWADTSKGRTLNLGEVKNLKSFGETPPEVIDITTQEGQHIKLVKLTLEIYNKKVKKRVIGSPSFNSDEALQKFYLESNFDRY